MSRNNDVTQVMVLKDDSTLIGGGNSLFNLAPGQLGIFDADRQISIDLNVAPNTVKNFFFAVGVDNSGDGILDDIVESAGQYIQKRNIVHYTYSPYSAHRPMVVEISDLKAACETDYALKVEVHNTQILQRQGTVPYSKTYSVRTSCCDECADCQSGDCNELVKLLLEAIELDGNEYFTAEAFNPAGMAGNVVADVDAFLAANAAVNTDDDGTNDVCLGIRITSVPDPIKPYTGINLRYKNSRATRLDVSLPTGFSCNKTTVKVTQEPANEQGLGYDINQKEYHAGGHNGTSGPYRVHSNTGFPKNSISLTAVATEKYDQIWLTSDFTTMGAWEKFDNQTSTLLAIPTSNRTLVQNVVNILDSLTATAGFDPLINDVNASTTNTDDVEDISANDDVDLDGVG